MNVLSANEDYFPGAILDNANLSSDMTMTPISKCRNDIDLLATKTSSHTEHIDPTTHIDHTEHTEQIEHTEHIDENKNMGKVESIEKKIVMEEKSIASFLQKNSMIIYKLFMLVLLLLIIWFGYKKYNKQE